MLTALVTPMRSAAPVDLVQVTLQDAGRLLLMTAMALFLAYALFLLGAVLFSAAAGRVPEGYRGRCGAAATRGGGVGPLAGLVRCSM